MIPINEDKVEFIISVAREYREGSMAMVSEELSENHAADNYTEHSVANMVESFTSEDHAMNSSYEELKSAIENLNEEERYALVALMWIGRGTYNPDEAEKAMNNARSSDNQHTAEYLMDTPLLPDYLEEGLIQIGK
ncbi:DUF3775 domain-containing protein [Pseudemcibacter aquimaris]|uniref:DUF3775 domain-containing protein n=1 Tax=Pseudemcibacter aquimaris TaxID=2857064 RepID=UPI002010F51F|nr:DUF3775 domain-containing protein [Pseudemcibacter aquimaris]MCC3862488.1 DUF3775 domain-containing protein [Pseudemcibacter aquimaris]WDU59084.1 DUF3775 domain-containing protein [Pseudemcibacter aquimaris]